MEYSIENISTQKPNGFDRRRFISLLATQSVMGLLALSGCGPGPWEALLQRHYKNLSKEELAAILARIKRELKGRFDRDFDIHVEPPIPGVRFGYGLDLSRCVGCRRCVHACARENNLSRNPQTHWIRVLEMEDAKGIDLPESSAYYCAPLDEDRTPRTEQVSLSAELSETHDGTPLSRDLTRYALSDEEKAILKNPDSQYPLYKKNPPGEGQVPRPDHFYMPVACQQCRSPQCVKVCPVKATWKEDDGIVVVDYNWCIGCRCCMSACPYGARHFNWAEPTIPKEELNTEVHYLGNRPRYKGHVEKCTFCVQRVRQGRYPACVEICPVGARKFGDLNDPKSEISYLVHRKRTFILKPELNTSPSFYYFYSL